jgi:hypothetical protein
MDSKRTRIAVRELPARPRKLDASEMSEIFGGCKHDDQRCEGNSEAVSL